MNLRQATLLEYLTEKSHQGLWSKRKQILKDLDYLYPTSDKGIYYENSALMLTKDIRQINNEKEFTIISNSQYGVKIATASELEEQLKRDEIKLAKMWGRLHRKRKKAGLHNQLEIKMNGDIDVYNAYLSEVWNG